MSIVPHPDSRQRFGAEESASVVMTSALAVVLAVMYGPMAAGIFWVIAGLNEEKQFENFSVMRIAGSEAGNLNRTLEHALQYGARYVCLDTGLNGESFRAETMHFFTSKSAAHEHSYVKRATENEYLTTLPVLPLQQLLHRNMELQQIAGSPGQAPKDITIDTGHILYLERAREEIFIEEISKQLRDRGIKPDLKELQKHITKDNQQFGISGTRREYGVEKPYNIQIGQNESRAFVINAIEPQQTIHQQKNQERMKSEVLEGTVQRQDAQEIKNKLQEEKDNGNRFVSFPADKAGLNKEDFTAFKTAFAAQEHAYENTTDRDRHIVRSIPVVEKEINQLEQKKEQQQEKPVENEREEKRSRGQELSR